VLFLASCLSLLGPAAKASQQIRFVIEPPLPPGETLAASLEAVRVDSVAETRQIRKSVELPTPVSLDLPARSTWTFRLIAKGYWSRETLVRAAAPDSTIDIRVQAAGTITGSVVLPRGEPLPNRMGVRLRSTAAGDPFEANVVCSIAEGRYSCDLPAGTFDIRFHLVGLASEYRWKVPVMAGLTTAQGAMQFRRGASVVGFVERQDQRPVAAGALVEARPFVPDSGGAGETASDDLRVIRGKPNSAGFFQLLDVPPGVYVVAASHQGFARASVFPVNVLENVESELREPLVLRPPVELKVMVDPPRAPDGAVWKGELFADPKASHSVKTVWRGESSPSGTFALKSLAPGHYRFFLEDASGTRFAWEEFELDDDPVPLVIALDLVRVEGYVELGDEPLAATLWFGRKNGRVAARLESDAEGSFSGVLSHAGSWPVDVEAEMPTVRAAGLAVDVQPAKDGAARVEIHLPSTRLAGQVVAEDQQPAAGAMVKWLTAGAAPGYVFAGADGGFEVAGVAPGIYSVDAEFAEASSDIVTIVTSEAMPAPDVRLTLRRRLSLSGRVASSSGAVPGALIAAVTKAASGRIDPIVSTAITDPVGDWRMTVPAATAEIFVVVQAPGYSMSSTRLAPPWDHPFPIEVHPEGGTILLTWTPSPPDSGAQNQPVLVQDGVMLDFIALTEWARVNGEQPVAAGRLRVPRLAPGNYSACLLTPAALDLLLRGVAAIDIKKCSSASLNAYDTVELIAR
jgi:hypothetical protein